MGERTLIMGVLNVTPDSFSDGGRYSDPDGAYARALEMEEEGADIIDIGAESTRPDSKRISAEEEWRRLLPVLKLLRDKLTIPLSLDTYKSEIAERALQYGVTIFNDPSGLTFDSNLAKVAAEHNAGLILNHMRGTPESWGKLPPVADVMGAVIKDLEATVSRARRAGVEKNRIVVDPGLGFGKRREQNSEILAHLERLKELDYPILVGPSRKSFLSHATDGETSFATAAAVTAAVLNGAHIVRVHDVKEMRSAAQIADEILRAAAAHKASQEAAQERVAPKPRVRPDFNQGREDQGRGDNTGRPMRPPLLRRDPPKPVETQGAPDQATERPADRTFERPAERAPERPVFRRPAADRPPRRDSGDRPERREFRPAAGRDRPNSDRPASDRPPRPFGDRPRNDQGRDDRGRDNRGRDDRGGDSRGGERPRSFRPGGDRPQGDRPPRRDGPAGGRPPRSGPPRSGPPRSGPPMGAAPRSGPPRNGPPRGASPRRPGGDRSPGGRPPGDRPPRPFRKRP